MDKERLKRAISNLGISNKTFEGVVLTIAMYIAGTLSFWAFLIHYQIPYGFLTLSISGIVWLAVCVVIDNYIWDYNKAK